MKNLFSLLLVCLMVLAGGMCLVGCGSESVAPVAPVKPIESEGSEEDTGTLKISYIRFDSYYVDLTLGPNYRFFAELNIENGTKSDQTIYANNFNAQITINDETYDSSITLCSVENGAILGDSVVVNQNESLKVFAVVESKITMGSNKQRKIVINYINEQICSFVPSV